MEMDERTMIDPSTAIPLIVLAAGICWLGGLFLGWGYFRVASRNLPT
jgi:hypothetical protein